MLGAAVSLVLTLALVWALGRALQSLVLVLANAAGVFFWIAVAAGFLGLLLAVVVTRLLPDR